MLPKNNFKLKAEIIVLIIALGLMANCTSSKSCPKMTWGNAREKYLR